MNGINIDTLSTLTDSACRELLGELLAGNLKVKDGTVVSPEPSKPRGPIARTAPRHAAARSTLLELAAGGCNALDVLALAADRYNYADIIKVAREELEKGTIIESKKGRKCTWTLPSAE